MTASIMVPLDGSEKDDRAIAVAVALSGLSGAGLHLVRVMDGAGPADFTAAAARVPARVGSPVTTELLAGADPADALVRHATASAARVIVMATRAPGAVDRALHASVSDAVMRESPCPVMLVPPGTDYMRDKSVAFGRVLVPLDGSVASEAVLDVLLELAGGAALEYALLEVVPRGGDREAAAARLEATAARLRAHGVSSVEYDVSEANDPVDAIDAAVRETLVDFIAMSSRGRSGVRRMVLGSVAGAVVRTSEVPVLLLTPRSLAAAGVHESHPA